ncbi:MAG TPA: hypothetical protein VFE47_29630 [Tepidisphaeraceae bacterium]|nr:hypothetical protein [Tepidisphaeraceae bacterium]
MIELSSAFVCVVTIFLILVAMKRLSYIEKQIAPLSLMNAKIDLLLKQARIEFDPRSHILTEIKTALQRGEKIQAIHYYRQASGVGLKEAKDYVEEIQAQG